MSHLTPELGSKVIAKGKNCTVKIKITSEHLSSQPIKYYRLVRPKQPVFL